MKNKENKPRICTLLDNAVRSNDGRKKEKQIRELSARFIQTLK